MPQMSPMWWTTIFTLSISTLIMTISFVYFMFKNKLKMTMENKKKYLIWKW